MSSANRFITQIASEKKNNNKQKISSIKGFQFLSGASACVFLHVFQKLFMTTV